ncbi:MAG: ABC transporter permease [Actinomycetota bacterium]|nr:ABC transporter permease [Actinomycetota bacterium]
MNPTQAVALGTRPTARTTALPRRAAGRPGGRLWAIRAPIPIGWRRGLIAASVLVPLLGWTVLSVSGLVPGRFLPTPVAVGAALGDMARSGQLVDDASASLQRVVLGFGLAVLVSVPLGVLIGSFRAGQALFEPIIGLLRYLPASAFIPLLIIWLGLGEPSKIMLLLIGTVFFNTLMTADAVRLVPMDVIQVSYTLGARRSEVLRKVIVPHALPGMVDAMRVNAAAAWNFVVVAELIASTSGLGYRIVRVQRFLETDKIFAVLVVIGLIGLTIDVGLRLLRQRLGRWHV